MNAKKISILFICASLWLHASGTSDPGMVWTPRKISEAWLVNGKIIAYDPGVANDRFFWNAVYFDREGNAWPLLGSYWNIVQMIRCELPGGIDLAFARNQLVSVLTEFNATEGLISDEDIIGQVIEGNERLSHDSNAQKLLRELLEKPNVIVSGNKWSARFMTIALRERIRMNCISGMLKPFSIQSEITETLTDEGADNFTIDRLRAALARKKALNLDNQ